MKKNLRLTLILTFAGLLAAPAFADQKPDTNAPPILVAPAPAPIVEPAIAPAAPETKPAKPAAKKKTVAKKKVVKAKPAKKPVVTGFSVPLKPGPATVAAAHVNVRGKPTINSEVLTRLTNGEPVTVIEEITRDNAKANDPTVWAKIVAPGSAHLWVSAQFVDTNKIVTVKKLNIRTGPGENYSVAGTLLKGDTVADIGAKDGWLEIQSGTNNFAYVAAAYLKQEAPAAPVETNAPLAPIDNVPTTTNAVAETAPVAPPPNSNELVPVNQLQGGSNVVTTTTTVVPPTAPPVAEEPPQPRIVQREGVVRRTFSIQAPTSFELVNPETGKTVNYLYTSAKTLDLRRYKGLHIIVTGEEELDERWKNTPVITIQKIQVVE